MVDLLGSRGGGLTRVGKNVGSFDAMMLILERHKLPFHIIRGYKQDIYMQRSGIWTRPRVS
jgi:hypothetical protein